MTGLETLYGNMRNNNTNHTIFYYVHANKVQLVVLFDIGTKPFSLFLIKKYSDKQSLSLTIERGFNLNILLPKNRYQLLLQMLEICGGITNRFSTKIFF